MATRLCLLLIGSEWPYRLTVASTYPVPHLLEMAATETAHQVRVGPQGRIVVPAELRKELGIEAGANLLASVHDGRLVLEPRDAVLARLQKRFAPIPASVSLADELIAERRAESARGNQG